MRFIILWLAAAALLVSAFGCSGSDAQPEAATDQEVEQAASTDTQSAPVEPSEDEAQQQTDGQRQAATSNTAAQNASEPHAEPQVEEQESHGFDPDAADLWRLIYWGPDDGFFGIQLPIPSAVQHLLDGLLASDSPAADKYIVDLAAYPNPFRDQVMQHLAVRFGIRLQTVYDYPEIWEFDPDDSTTQAYLRFKQDLFAASLKDMSLFLDPEAERTIDAREVMWGGVNIDGIPPLEHPTQIWPDEAADWILDSDIVVGVELNGDTRAYPIRIIAWHEMVNDTIGGIPVSLAYCTLCGSPILFDGRFGSEVYRFGTSGLLYRSNKLMYDRNTRTLWNQFTGRPAWGPLAGDDIRLEVLPVVVSTWADWYAQHPDTTVLDIETGFVRDYGSGVAYNDYFNTSLTWFNVPVVDGRLAQKDDVYVVRIGDELTAYPIKVLARDILIQDEVGGVPIVVIATAERAGGRSYESGEVRFASADPGAGTLLDSEGQMWTISENSLLGPDGQSLPRVGGHNAYWFAVTNQTDNGRLWEG